MGEGDFLIRNAGMQECRNAGKESPIHSCFPHLTSLFHLKWIVTTGSNQPRKLGFTDH
jgi:hypothetical protein